MSADFMRKLNTIIGIPIKPTKRQSWQTTMEQINAGTLDILFSVTRTPQRETFLLFSKPYLRFPMVIVTAQNAPYIGTMKDLKGKKIAVVNGYASHDILKNNHPELDLFVVDNLTKGLNAVLRQKAYAFIGNLAAISHVIGREGFPVSRSLVKPLITMNCRWVFGKISRSLPVLFKKALTTSAKKTAARFFNAGCR